MFFITKKKFENEVRYKVDQELCRIEENRYRANEIREVHKRVERLEMRLEKVEEKCGIPTNLTAVTPKCY